MEVAEIKELDADFRLELISSTSSSEAKQKVENDVDRIREMSSREEVSSCIIV